MLDIPARLAAIGLLALLALAAMRTAALGDEGPVEVIVHLASGRSFAAEIDERTSAERLWLRFRGTSTVILRPVEWRTVRGAVVGDEQLDGDAFRDRALQLRAPLPEDARAIVTPNYPPVAAGATPALVPAGGPSFAAQAAWALGPPPQVRAVHAEVGVANWDADVEVDGLLLRVSPLDWLGGTLPVAGSVEVELLGHERGESITRLGRWVRRLDPWRVGPSGAVFRLPFQAQHPEFNLRLAPKASVHVTLTVPGQGVFEDTATPVRIRPYSSERDYQQQDTGQRFFRGERTGRSS